MLPDLPHRNKHMVYLFSNGRGLGLEGGLITILSVASSMLEDSLSLPKNSPKLFQTPCVGESL